MLFNATFEKHAYRFLNIKCNNNNNNNNNNSL